LNTLIPSRMRISRMFHWQVSKNGLRTVKSIIRESRIMKKMIPHGGPLMIKTGLKLLILTMGLITISCNNSSVPATNVNNASSTPTETSVKAIESPTSQASSGNEVPLFESFPETSANGSLEDKYDLQTYIETNKVLQDIPFSAVDNYKVRFTSDGGAVFSVKAEQDNPDYLWKRTPQKLLFDTFQLVNITQENNNTKYFSRYSQLIENEITVNDTVQNYSKKATLVQTVGLSLVKNDLRTGNPGFKIATFTPVVIRQVEKNSLPYKIEKLTLQAENIADFNIDSEKTLIPWPGISFDNYLEKKKLKIIVAASADQAENRNLAVLISIQGSQYQLEKGNDNTFSAEIELSALNSGKNSIIIELIDKKSLEETSKYQGYTWVIPIIVN
jgi:hypothetical protein